MARSKNKKSEILKALESVLDPELNISIVDLGLIYDIKQKPGEVFIKMTLTTPGCPLVAVIEHQIKEKLLSLKGVKEVKIELTFDPPWTPDRLSQKARARLGLTGLK